MYKLWHMKQSSKTSRRQKVFKAGHDNEPLLARSIYTLCQGRNNYENPIKMKSMKQCRLMENKQKNTLATSADGLAIFEQCEKTITPSTTAPSSSSTNTTAAAAASSFNTNTTTNMVTHLAALEFKTRNSFY
eukprot:Awhi_evm1s7563